MVNAVAQFCKLARFTRGFSGICVAGGMAVSSAMGQTPGLPSDAENNIEHCRTIKDDGERLRCYEAATSAPAPRPAPPVSSSHPAQPQGSGPGTWRLVRTPNPAGGRDAVSIMQTADITKSDINLAGLMVRCGEAGLETLVVLVTPLPPRAHPKVTVKAGGASEEFTGTVVPPGAVILLPPEATALASGPWRSAAELSIKVADKLDEVSGVVPLSGLAAALPMLISNCPTQ